MSFVQGVVLDCVQVNGKTRFLLELENDCLRQEFFEHCEYLKQYHDEIYVNHRKTKTIITVHCGAFVENGSALSGSLSVTLHHLAGRKPTVVWTLEDVKII